MIIATNTLKAIEEMIRKDQGASFRGWQAQVLPHIGDAYDTGTFPFRSHLGASGIGRDCPRQIWYDFRWATLQENTGQQIRLFNRGHLEEGRFIAMLLGIGVQVFQQDEHGNQFRVSEACGHAGGSGDGKAIGLPDLPPGQECLLEFKTSNEKNFVKLQKEGVKLSKFEHYVQMNIYMGKMGIPVSLYMCVNKNTDELYAEIVHYDRLICQQYSERMNTLAFMDYKPKKLSKSRSNFVCKYYCNHKQTCHYDEPMFKTCRSCQYSIPWEDGNWHCKKGIHVGPLTKEQQLEACDNWIEITEEDET